MNFRAWVISEYKDRWHDPISDLAGDLVYDDCWPADDTYAAAVRHLDHHGASASARECLRVAFDQYMAQKGSKG